MFSKLPCQVVNALRSSLLTAAAATPTVMIMMTCMEESAAESPFGSGRSEIVTLEGEDEIMSRGTMGTFTVDQDEDQSGAGHKCGFCRKPKITSCDCIKGVPKELAYELRDLLSEGHVSQAIQQYLLLLKKKEKDRTRRAENVDLQNFVYSCDFCEEEVLRGHICKYDAIPRSLLEEARIHLPATWHGLLDAALEQDDFLIHALKWFSSSSSSSSSVAPSLASLSCESTDTSVNGGAAMVVVVDGVSPMYHTSCLWF